MIKHKLNKFQFITVVLVALLLTSPVSAHRIDRNFGVQGQVLTDAVPNVPDYSNGILFQPDGKMIVVGASIYPLVAVRYNQDGSLDASFGSNGKAVMGDVAPAGSWAVLDSVLQPDGKILTVGRANGSGPGLNVSNIVIARMNPNGSLDTNFGSNGVVRTSFPNTQHHSANAVALTAEGKIIVAGVAYNSDFLGINNYRAFLIRYYPNGTLDPTFGNSNNGYMTYTIQNVAPNLSCMSLRPDGKIIIGGTVRLGNPPFYDFYSYLKQIGADGLPNATGFGNDGVALMPFPQYSNLSDLVVQPDGKFLLVGGSDDFMLTRFTADGYADTAFGQNGIARTDFFNGSYDEALAATITDSGKIAVVGGTRPADSVNNIGDFAIAQYNLSGALETKTRLDFSPTKRDYATDAAIQEDGRIVVAGTSFTDSPERDTMFAVARFTHLDDAPLGVIDRSFDIDGDDRTDISVYRPGAQAAAQSYWYSILTTGFGGNQILAAQFGIGEDVIVPADYNGDGKTDLAIFRPSSGLWAYATNPNGAAANFVTVRWGQAGDIPVAADFDGDSKADFAVFRPSTGVWYILHNESFTTRFVQWGVSGDKPIAGDFDGDGRADIAVYRPSNGSWYVLRSLSSRLYAVQFGTAEDVPAAADYDGDEQTDIAVYRPSSGVWYALESRTGNLSAVQWGAGADIPVPGDYDQDGKTDRAVYRPGTPSNWYIRMSQDNALLTFEWGAAADTPIPGS